MKNLGLYKKSLLFFVAGILISLFVTTAFAAGESSSDAYNWKDGSANYSNSAKVDTFSAIDPYCIRGWAYIRSDQKGFFGVRSNIINDSYVLVHNGLWTYNSTAATSLNSMALLMYPQDGKYMVQGETAYNKTGSYITQYTYGTSFISYP